MLLFFKEKKRKKKKHVKGHKKVTRGIRKKERKKSPSADDPIRRAARGGIKGSGATDSTKEGRKFDEAEKEICGSRPFCC